MSSTDEVTEQRREPRVPRREAVHIQITSGGPGSAVLHCQTEDISATGFKVHTAAPIAQGHILELLIEVDGDGKRYVLVAETRWCRAAEPGFQSGFELLDAEHSDIEPWRALFGAG